MQRQRDRDAAAAGGVVARVPAADFVAAADFAVAADTAPPTTVAAATDMVSDNRNGLSRRSLAATADPGQVAQFTRNGALAAPTLIAAAWRVGNTREGRISRRHGELSAWAAA